MDQPRIIVRRRRLLAARAEYLKIYRTTGRREAYGRAMEVTKRLVKLPALGEAIQDTRS